MPEASKATNGEMKAYTVRFPVVGVMSFYVEAESEDDAIAKAWDTEWQIQTEYDNTVEIEELNLVESITTGNVCHAPLGKVQVIES